MIIRSEDFVPRVPDWESDSSVPEDLKQELRERGLADSLSRVECLEIVDDCFGCGAKLTTPYIYWHGVTGNLSLHPQCAGTLALSLLNDLAELNKQQRIALPSELRSKLSELLNDM